MESREARYLEYASRPMNRPIRILLALALLLGARAALAFDQTHAAWDTLLQRHVVLSPNGNASRVDYAGPRKERAALQAYLGELSSVAPTEFNRWSREQRLAFLINAYNAFTADLILTRYPDLQSIKDLGSFLQSPWKKAFFKLLGEQRSLDDVEHGMIRAPGAFDEPRIHFAVNCASLGCPMLRREAYVAERLESQLENALRRFLADRSRNRHDAAAGALQLSKIFDWYKGDFEKGHRGIRSVPQFLAAYADLLADDAAVREARLPVRYLEYDWKLNAAGAESVGGDVRTPHDVAPLLVVRLHPLAQFLRRAGHRVRPFLEQVLLHVCRFGGLADLRVEPLHDRLRRAGGREDRVPDRDLEARQAGLGDGLEVRHLR